MVPQGSLLH